MEIFGTLNFMIFAATLEAKNGENSHLVMKTELLDRFCLNFDM